ncbi:MAG: sigma-70 family RNA polymerase sigma factor [Bacteroidetes bacterium]|nr:sigma-70 family RNA polymerase sigma factor [Bacteroidota bacterium]
MDNQVEHSTSKISPHDREIIEQFRNEETRNYAFNLLVREYQKRLYWHIRKIIIDHDDTDDVLQNVFIKVWRHLSNFKEEAQLFTWMYRIATNESINFLNAKKKRAGIPLDDVSAFLANNLESDSYYKGDEIQTKLQKAILTLPDKQRIVFNMKYFEEMKYEEMSKILETSVGALKASYHHAVKKIEEYLTTH